MRIRLVKMSINKLLFSMLEQSSNFWKCLFFVYLKIYVTALNIVSITYIFFKKNSVNEN